MTPVTCMAGRRVALFGLGGSGLATALALKAGGADVLAWDDSAASLEKARAHGIATGDLRGAEASGFASLVLAPGVPLTHPEPHWTVDWARSAGLEIIGDIELFCRERATIAPDAPFVAITGTNGKSTTTALVAHILRSAGRDVQMGGNIGTAILSLAPPAVDRVHVIEMSSFQIDLTPSLGPSPGQPNAPHAEVRAAGEPRSTQSPGASFDADLGSAPQDEEGGELSLSQARSGPTIGVLLNITPDHLDRHGTLENYAAIKERLVAGADLAIVGIDDGPGQAIFFRRQATYPGDTLFVSAGDISGFGYRFAGTSITAELIEGSYPVADLAGSDALRGAHNAQNAAVAVGVAQALGMDQAAIAAGLSTFPGLAHRMEQIGRRGRAIFVNDSKATNADSTEKALLSFEHVHWILGGKAKEGGIEPLKALFTKVDKAYLIGEASEAFAATLEGGVPYVRCGTLDRAVAAAAEDAMRSSAREPVVLLSPACASYDQYPNFEVRGDHFKELVRALPGIEMRS